MNRNENGTNQSETKKPKSKAGIIFFVIALTIGFLCLIVYWYAMGMARGFSNH